jgi:hypothetical protein
MTSIFDFVRSEEKKKPISEEIKEAEAPIENKKEILAKEPSILIEEKKKMSPIFEQARQPVKEQSLPNPVQKSADIQENNEPVPFEGENDLDREIERNQARTTSRGIETVAGLPGDLESFARWVIGNDKETFLPTSKGLQEKAEKLPGGQLKAKNEFEEKSDEFFKDIVSMSIPGSGQASFVRNLGIPIAGLLAKEGVKKIGSGEKEQAYGKMGTMFILDLLNTRRTMGMGGARRFASHLFNESERMIPQGATTTATNLQRDVRQAINALESGGTAPSTASALTKLREIEGAIQNGRIPVRFLVDARKRINDIIDAGGGFDYSVKTNVRRRAINNLNNVKNHVIDSLQEYGQANPRFGAINNAANEAYAAYSASNTVSNFLKKNFGDKIQNGTLKTILGWGGGGIGVGGLATGIGYAPAASAAGIAALPAYQVFKVARRMFTSPVLRNYYTNIIRHSLQGNVAQTATNIRQLERELDKKDKEQEKKILELRKSSKTDKSKKSDKNKT